MCCQKKKEKKKEKTKKLQAHIRKDMIESEI